MKRSKEQVYHFTFLEIEKGDFLFRFSGKAFYSIIDAGSGAYEFWGQRGTDRFFTAEFFRVFISDWEVLKWDAKQRTFEKGDSEEIGGLTEADRHHYENEILENLNDNFTLCQRLVPTDPPESWEE